MNTQRFHIEKMLESEWQEEKTPSSRVKLVEAQVYDMKCNENSNMEGESNIFLLDEVILRPLDNINSSNENKNFLSEIDNTLQQLRKWQLKREENSHDDMIDESIHRTRTTFLPSDNDLSETHEIHRANQETVRFNICSLCKLAYF